MVATRRVLLYGLASAAALGPLSACTSQQETGTPDATAKPSASRSGSHATKGSATKPLRAPAQLTEAPALAAKVKAGKLPPLRKRIPHHPYVVPHRWLEPGRYGGTLRIPTAASTSFGPSNIMYGHSPLRYLNDGLDLGPGLIESWESNDDASRWTLHLRAGVRWSDGEPLTATDALYWWEDLVLNKEYQGATPDGARSSTGKQMKLVALDDNTLRVEFDAPTPEAQFQWARYTHSDTWFQPKHYLKQFHPTYNFDAPKDWVKLHAQKMNYAQNPDCPTLTGWRLVSYREGKSIAWERNPYYWCVDPKGKQLPYIDRMQMTPFQEPQVAKLKIQQGDFDYVGKGPSVPIALADVDAIKGSRSQSGMRVLLWNSGSGSGPVFFFNQDYQDDEMRKLIRTPAFRQALSHAFNRKTAAKTIYFNSGEPTTGTYSPQAIEYQTGAKGKAAYTSWRDSYVSYDPEKAASILDKLGVVDADGDGKRELPSGKKLVVRISFPADTTEDYHKHNALLKRDWQKIGITVQLHPTAPTSFDAQWESGELMARSSWEVSTVHDHLVLFYWFAATRPTVWAPLQGQWWQVQGTSAEGTEQDVSPWKRSPPRIAPEPGGPVERLWKGVARAQAEQDGMKRTKLVWDMIKIHVEDGPFYQGTVANYPVPFLVHEQLRNVPKRSQLALGGLVNTSSHPTPAVYDPEAFYWTDPDKHA